MGHRVQTAEGRRTNHVDVRLGRMERSSMVVKVRENDDGGGKKGGGGTGTSGVSIDLDVTNECSLI